MSYYEMIVTRRTPVQWKNQRTDDRPLVSITKGGEPVQGLVSERITSVSVEEEVLKLAGAGHIHAWFARKAKEPIGTYGTIRITANLLEELLATCEKVLFASQLVPADRYSAELYSWSNEAKQAVGNPRKTIKNVNVAHQELPASASFGDSGNYDEKYLRDVEDTRTAIAKLKSERFGLNDGEFYYTLSRAW